MSGMDDWQLETNERMRTDTRHLEAAAAAMIKFVEYGVPSDVMQVLVNGSKRIGARPGALVAALSAAIGVYQRS